jgi:hypothetical protein
MPYSFDFYNKEVLNIVCLLAPNGKILEVGPGCGKYGKELKKSFPDGIDAIEIFESYIERFNLESVYRKIYIGDVRNVCLESDDYEIVIMGDVIEHMLIKDAQAVIKTFSKANCGIIAMVPYLYPQDECFDNPHEAHIQPDLTEEIFLQRYPGFIKIVGNSQQGVFLKTAAKMAYATIV